MRIMSTAAARELERDSRLYTALVADIYNAMNHLDGEARMALQYILDNDDVAAVGLGHFRRSAEEKRKTPRGIMALREAIAARRAAPPAKPTATGPDFLRDLAATVERDHEDLDLVMEILSATLTTLKMAITNPIHQAALEDLSLRIGQLWVDRAKTEQTEPVKREPANV